MKIIKNIKKTSKLHILNMSERLDFVSHLNYIAFIRKLFLQSYPFILRLN